jgi:hypothetical protein
MLGIPVDLIGIEYIILLYRGYISAVDVKGIKLHTHKPK